MRLRVRRLRAPTRQRHSLSANRFELCLNRVQDGFFSPFLFDLQPGDTVDMKGPYGYFTWRQPVSDSILVATGTGIAPFRGMIHGYLADGGEREITLVYGVRYEPSLLYREEFERLAELAPELPIPADAKPSGRHLDRAHRTCAETRDWRS